MKPLILFFLMLGQVQAEWRQALPGWKYKFPRDHGPHPDFKTEWWYFTGNVQDGDGRGFGYELTFFRQGLREPDRREPGESAWIANEIALAHFAITDMEDRRFFFDHRLTRATLGLAGFGDRDRRAWIDHWSLRASPDGTWHLRASNDRMRIEVSLKASKPPAIHGQNGVSQKSAERGRASHYYSLSRLLTAGEIQLGKEIFKIVGNTWFDHEWASHQLTRQQTGWDWFGLHLDDGSDLMLYQLRLKEGGSDPASSGTLIRPDGTTVHLPREAFRLLPGETWSSANTKVAYPLHWKIEVPGHGLALEIAPLLDAQEMRVPPAAYWEGAVKVTGSRVGTGYMELTGYGGPVIGVTD